MISESKDALHNRSQTTFSITWWGKRTNLERKLCWATTLIAVILISLSCILGWVYFTCKAVHKKHIQQDILNATLTASEGNIITTSVKTQENVCLTKGCIEAAQILLANGDFTQNPCNDFYQFACGGYQERMVIPDDETAVGQILLLRTNLEQQLRSLLEDPGKSSSDCHAMTLAKDFYSSCTNIAMVRKAGLAPVDKILEIAGGLPVLLGDSWSDENFTWEELVHKMKFANLSADDFITLHIVEDFKNNSRMILGTSAPFLGVQVASLKEGMTNTMVKDYLQYLIEAMVLLGADKDRAQKEMTDVINLEMKLAHISPDSTEKRDISSLYTLKNISTLQQMVPEVNWLKYFQMLLTFPIDESEPVLIMDLNYIQNFVAILKETSPRTLANYALGREAITMSSIVDKRFSKLRFRAFQRHFGLKEDVPRWKKCMTYTRMYFAEPLSASYIKKYFATKDKMMVTELVELIRSEFRSILNESKWLDESTKVKALNKLSAMEPRVAFPNELLNNSAVDELFEGLVIKRDEFLWNLQRINGHEEFNLIKSLRKPVKKYEWRNHANIVAVNAFYKLTDNSINIPAGILQGIFYSPDRPQYLNFASIGTVVGHELTHGFDDSGRQFDESGNMRNWWNPETDDLFRKNIDCMINQYNQYTDPTVNMKLNGNLTIGENVADNGGVKQAYRAYQRWLRIHDHEQTLPGLDFTPDQLFWLSFANNWCKKERPEALKIKLRTSHHSPNRFRVNGPLSNMQAFAESFNCPPRSPMNPATKCIVW